MNRFAVTHVTTYRYQTTVSSSYGQACLLPRSFPGQSVLSASVAIDPSPADLTSRQDAFGNYLTYFEVRTPHQMLAITAISEVEVNWPDGQFPLGAQEPLATVISKVDSLQGQDRIEAVNYLTSSDRVPLDNRVQTYGAASFQPATPVIDCIRDLTQRIHRDFTFDSKATDVNSTIDELFEKGGGVCQDFTHLAVACLRAAGLPARYVSGYLETFPPPGQPKLVGSDVSHAWASALIPGVGWIDFDPTNNQFINDRYVTVAWGRDYADVTPVKGVIYSDGGMTKLDVSVDVRRIVPAQQQSQQQQ